MKQTTLNEVARALKRPARGEGADAVGSSVCLFAATMEEVRARLVDHGQIDETHDEWLTDHDIYLDDAQVSTSELICILPRREDA